MFWNIYLAICQCLKTAEHSWWEGFSMASWKPANAFYMNSWLRMNLLYPFVWQLCVGVVIEYVLFTVKYLRKRIKWRVKVWGCRKEDNILFQVYDQLFCAYFKGHFFYICVLIPSWGWFKGCFNMGVWMVPEASLLNGGGGGGGGGGSQWTTRIFRLLLVSVVLWDLIQYKDVTLPV